MFESKGFDCEILHKLKVEKGIVSFCGSLPLPK